MSENRTIELTPEIVALIRNAANLLKDEGCIEGDSLLSLLERTQKEIDAVCREEGISISYTLEELKGFYQGGVEITEKYKRILSRLGVEVGPNPEVQPPKFQPLREL